ncbi:MAG: UPF0149 family protein [Legionellales bacterium]|nr:UPF0149 family protein [Legionellales bacterium]
MNYPEYDEIVDSFGSLANICNPAYVHGIICGSLCFNVSFSADDWLHRILIQHTTFINITKPKIAEISVFIHELFDVSKNMLNSAEFDFDLLLPDDSEELSYRTIALVDWCRGFIEIYEMVKQSIKISNESQEVIDYMIETTQMDIEYNSDNEEEKAFFEVCEFIRLSALMLFMELRKSLTSNEGIIH